MPCQEKVLLKKAAFFHGAPPHGNSGSSRRIGWNSTKGKGAKVLVSTLDQLPVGSSATVSGLAFAGGKRRRMLDLGFVPGAEVSALQASPWGDPVAYGVLGTVIALRREDAAHIAISQEGGPVLD